MKRRIVCILTILAVFVCNTIPVSAIEETFSTERPLFESQVALSARNILKFMEPEKELYGMGEVDFLDLCLGAPIPAYVVLDGEGIVQENNVLYYPILSGTKWVATAIVFWDSTNKMNMQISTQYAKKYNETEQLGEITLLFDDSTSYLVTGNEILTLSTTSIKVPGRTSLDKEANLDVLGASLTAECVIDMTDSGTSRSFDYNHFIYVPCIEQDEGSLQCWAACIASIRSYYGTDTTIDDVYEYANITKYNGADIYKAANVLENYGFYVSFKWQGSYTFYQLRTAIYLYETPIFAACYYNDRQGHAVVIRGFTVYHNSSQIGSVAYMDPATGEYGACSFSTDGDFQYLSLSTMQQYSMTGFLEVSE